LGDRKGGERGERTLESAGKLKTRGKGGKREVGFYCQNPPAEIVRTYWGGRVRPEISWKKLAENVEFPGMESLKGMGQLSEEGAGGDQPKSNTFMKTRLKKGRISNSPGWRRTYLKIRGREEKFFFGWKILLSPLSVEGGVTGVNKKGSS